MFQYLAARDSYPVGFVAWQMIEKVQKVAGNRAGVDCNRSAGRIFLGNNWQALVARRSKDWVVVSLAASTQVLRPLVSVWSCRVQNNLHLSSVPSQGCLDQVPGCVPVRLGWVQLACGVCGGGRRRLCQRWRPSRILHQLLRLLWHQYPVWILTGSLDPLLTLLV